MSENKLTKAEEIIELHLGSEFYRFKESEWYFNIKNAVNEAINYTRYSMIENGQFVCGKQDFTSSKNERCLAQCDECKWRGKHK